MKYLALKILFLTITLFILSSCSNNSTKVPKNIIIFIGDGMGYNHVDAASMYQYGETGKQIYESFPIKIGMSTDMIGGEVYNADSAWVDFKFVTKKPTDSAASGTAIATGHKTYKSGLSVDTLKNKLNTILDYAELVGKSTGVVSTVPFSNATPAAFVAHNESRYNYKDIAIEMIMESKVDVIMGGGHPLFNPDGTQISGAGERVVGEKEIYDMTLGDKSVGDEKRYKYVGGKNAWNALVAGNAGADADNDGLDDPWLLIQDRKEFQKYINGETPKRVAGIFKSGQSSQVERINSANSRIPFESPLNEEVPTLAEMTLAAINILDNNPKGFVLMSEGGAIDWVAHSNLLHSTIEEQIDFNNSIEAACKWVEENSSWDETLIIVTADHETGYLVGPGSNKSKSEIISETWQPIVNNGKGQLPTVEWHSRDHTNSLVPFYAKGIGSSKFLDVIKGLDVVRGKYIDNSDIGLVISKFMKDK